MPSHTLDLPHRYLPALQERLAAQRAGIEADPDRWPPHDSVEELDALLTQVEASLGADAPVARLEGPAAPLWWAVYDLLRQATEALRDECGHYWTGVVPAPAVRELLAEVDELFSLLLTLGPTPVQP